MHVVSVFSLGLHERWTSGKGIRRMATSRSISNGIAAKCRQIGWEVVTEKGGNYLYKIVPPRGQKPIYLHSSPSDPNWEKIVWFELNRAGFQQAEADLLARNKTAAEARTAAARDAAATKTTRLAKQTQARIAAAGPYTPQPADLGWLLTPHEFRDPPRCLLMTPEVAQKILDTANTHNRPLQESRWLRLAQVIRDGEWGCTHQGGAFDTNGVLLDGQHRLRAIVETGQTVEMMWSVGMPPETFRKVDTGAGRTARDAAWMRKEVSPGILTSAARLLIWIDRHGPNAHIRSRTDKLSIDTVDASIVNIYGDALRDAVALGYGIKRRQIKYANAASVAAAVYLIADRLPKNDPRGAQFVRDFEYGEGVSRADPVWHLRRKLLNAGTGRDGYDVWEQTALIIKAWNHVAGAKGDRVMKELTWHRSTEAFPAVPFLPPPLT